MGIVVPSVNTVMEPWAQKVVPDGVSIFASRMFIPPAMTPDAFIEMDRNEGKAAIRQLSSVFPDAIAYGCTASSIVQGLAYDAHLRAEIEETYKAPSTTAAHAILTAAKTLGIATVSIVSPYTKEVDEAEHRYFAGAGLTVVGGACLGIADGFALGRARARLAVRAGHARLRRAGGRPDHDLPQHALAHRDRPARTGARQAGDHLDAGDAVACAAARRHRRPHRGLRDAPRTALTVFDEFVSSLTTPCAASLHAFGTDVPLARGAHLMSMSATEWRGPSRE